MVSVPFTRQIRLIVAPAWAVLATSSSTAAAAMNFYPARKAMAVQMRKQTEEKAPSEHYDAPYALIDLWHDHGGDADAMQKAEIESFATLLDSATAQALIRVFFLRRTLKSGASGASVAERAHR